jgi:SAM-dependent methyltransferase
VNNDDDVPTAVDFLNPAHARDWTETTIRTRLYRPRFFAAICQTLAPLVAPRILELGSGPGHLAREIVCHCNPREYIALDFSPAMHDLARDYLAELAPRVTFETRDFRSPAWTADLGRFDAVVTMQAAHETRHKRHLLPLLERARSVIEPGGLLLYCDSYLTADTKKPGLFVARAEQPLTLERAGFTNVTLLDEDKAIALYRATA